MSRRQAETISARCWTRWFVLGCLALGLTIIAPVFDRAAVPVDGGVFHVVKKGRRCGASLGSTGSMWTISCASTS